MSACLFLTFRFSASVAEDEMVKLDGVLRAVPRLSKALVHTSSSASDPYVKDDSPPQLVLQLYFRDVSDLEESLSRKGSLRGLGSRAEFPSLVAADVTHQAMLVRPFAVPEPAFQNSPGAPYCTYLVSYEGEAENINAWLDHYLDRHTIHMARFPGIRLLEVYTRLDWVSAMPWRRANFMQRNNVAFDSPDALTQALHSPVRHEMRADFKTFPPFTGPTSHYAMATRVAHRGSV
jgi:hypothetical protein